MQENICDTAVLECVRRKTVGDDKHAANEAKGRPLSILSLSALGIVYGDIGTSPLYAFKQCFNSINGIAASPENVLGVLSLIVWSLIIVVSIKYLLFILKADNSGEGGIIALVALLNPWNAAAGTARNLLMLLGLFGAALLFGDGTITPAISVLSAIEGLQVENAAFKPFVIPITIGILIVLFSVQKRGTAKIGALFGPVMLVWFLILALLGIGGILQEPLVFAALSPTHGARFLIANGMLGFVVLGTVFLAVTGAEALYADLGHFGPAPIRLAWFVVALPALLLNYFGQGAMVLADASAVAHPFYQLSPGWAHYPLVIMATIATIIASQAVISGVFSLTRQAVQLGQLPRIDIIQTDSHHIGQIYIPSINWLLMIATIALVVGFRTSDNLGAAYGLAVSADMVITTCLAFFVAKRFGWNPWLAGTLAAAFLVVDLAFLIANSFKFFQGGWYPVVVATVIFMIMAIWRQGIAKLRALTRDERQPLDVFLAQIKTAPLTSVAGTAVYLTAMTETTPSALVQIMEHMPILHERSIFLTVKVEDVPRVASADRIELSMLENDIYRVVLHYGFMQHPNVPVALKLCSMLGLEIDPETVTYFVGLDDIEPAQHSTLLKAIRIRIFSFLWRNGERMSDSYNLSSERTIVIGKHIRL